MGSRPPSLAQIFSTSVDQFQNVDLDSSFGDRYSAGLIALRMAGLRLSRWGTAMNINKDPELAHSNLNGSLVQVRKELIQLAEHIQEAQRRPGAGGGRNGSGSAGHLSPPQQNLVDKIEEICERRVVNTGTSLAPWALRREEDLEQLMGKVLRSLDRLDGLCPTDTAQMYAKLTAVDSQQLALARLGALESLMKTVQLVDPRLAESCEPKSQGNTYRSVRVRGYCVGNGDWIADSFAGEFKNEGNNYEEIVVENGQLINGNSYGGTGAFSSPSAGQCYR